MVFNLGEPNSSLFLSEFSQLVRSNSNHQKTLLRFDPRGKSLSSSLLPSESSSALVIFGRRDKSPSTSWSPSPKFFLPSLPSSMRFPSKGNATRFQIESLTLLLWVKVWTDGNYSGVVTIFQDIFIKNSLSLRNDKHTLRFTTCC